MRKWMKRSLATAVAFCMAGGIGALGVNAYVKSSVKDRILDVDAAAELEGVDCILILGCGVQENGRPSAMLTDRLLCGMELYNAGVAPKLLMSGDHGRVEYDEVNAMKQFAIDEGSASEDVFMDHAGFSTYESVYRAKEIFQADKVIIVTQSYHLYRALYIAKSLGIEAYGVGSDQRTYYNQSYRDVRELLARNKDFFGCLLKPKPTFLGEAIPVSGNGNVTNDTVDYKEE